LGVIVNLTSFSPLAAVIHLSRLFSFGKLWKCNAEKGWCCDECKSDQCHSWGKCEETLQQSSGQCLRTCWWWPN